MVHDEQHPWPGLSPFDEAGQRFFHGRDSEAAELRRIVLQSPLAVLFGVSGLGKTSLLKAGLFPLLRRDNILPVYVRLDVTDASTPLMDQARRALEREFEAHQVDAPAFQPGESLWQYLHRADLEIWSAQNQLLTPLFVFDQFEEVLTLGGENRTGVAQFRHDLADLVENRLPSAMASRHGQADDDAHRYDPDSRRSRVLLSFREDFLAAVEEWKRDLPSLQRSRARLRPMAAKQAFRAVRDTAPHLVTDRLARQIVSFVAQAPDNEAPADTTSTPDVTVEPNLLSLVCHGLNEKRLARGESQIDEALLRETGPSIVADFYRDALRGVPGSVRRFIEQELITERGHRKQCDVDDAEQRYGLTAEQLQLLIERRLLRVEPSRGSPRIELMHDLLTHVVREHREEERQRDRRRRYRWRAGIAAMGVAVAGSIGFGFHRQNEKAHEAADASRQLAIDSVVHFIDSMARDGVRDSTKSLNEKRQVVEVLLQITKGDSSSDGHRWALETGDGLGRAAASLANARAVVAARDSTVRAKVAALDTAAAVMRQVGQRRSIEHGWASGQWAELNAGRVFGFVYLCQQRQAHCRLSPKLRVGDTLFVSFVKDSGHAMQTFFNAAVDRGGQDAMAHARRWPRRAGMALTVPWGPFEEPGFWTFRMWDARDSLVVREAFHVTPAGPFP